MIMPSSLTSNRTMFWRIVRRLITAHRGRLFVILLALSAGATITAALLNLQIDAKRRITTEFRAFGPNVIVLPKTSLPLNADTFAEPAVGSIPVDLPSGRVSVSSALYVRANVSAPPSESPLPTVVAGLNPLAYLRAMSTPLSTSVQTIPRGAPVPSPAQICVLGDRVAKRLQAQQGAELTLSSADHRELCVFASSRSTGGPEDDRVEIGLRAAQRLADLPGRISAIELIVPGTSQEVERYVQSLRQNLPEADVRPIRQFTEAQSKIYNRISGLLNFTVALVLVLTGLCVMAAMTNVAMERRNDVGLMKAIGGARRRVLRLFLAEATLLGLAGGIIGAAAGIALSMYLGKAVFGLAARPRLIVYPVSVALTLIVAIFSAYPLRHLASIRPASVFRGEA
jgi:putative ABC transport system permease protein